MLFQRDRRPGQIEIKIGQKEGEYSLTFTSSVRRIQPCRSCCSRTAGLLPWPAGQDRAKHDFFSGAHDTGVCAENQPAQPNGTATDAEVVLD